MPELPEVQTVVNDLIDAGLIGKTISAAIIHWPRIVHTPSLRVFRSRITGTTILNVRRRAKYIVIDLSGGLHLLIHLRMTGRLHFIDPESPIDSHENAVFVLHNSDHLRFHDTRKFGRLYLVSDSSDILKKIGPEPLDDAFSPSVLYAILHGRKRMLKPLLLDQTVIAGLGNIYVDEALWEARLHPCRISNTLSRRESKALHRAIRKVLLRGLANLGTTLGTGHANFYSVGKRTGRNKDELQVFRRTGQPCPRCHKPVKRLIVGQRSTHICPQCQKDHLNI